MKIQFKLEYVFGDILGKESISSEHITKLITFFSQNDVNINFCININIFIPRKKIYKDFQPTAPPGYE